MNDLQLFKMHCEMWHKNHPEHDYVARTLFYQTLINRFGHDFAWSVKDKIRTILDRVENETKT
ncbi:MAG: hypothetical protein PHU23_16500 [Dehalococcoidales bacterium]|nr:hypothetical protein [Dehalococcoidales bacterium]